MKFEMNFASLKLLLYFSGNVSRQANYIAVHVISKNLGRYDGKPR